jgi:hypothetical protein
MKNYLFIIKIFLKIKCKFIRFVFHTYKRIYFEKLLEANLNFAMIHNYSVNNFCSFFFVWFKFNYIFND